MQTAAASMRTWLKKLGTKKFISFVFFKTMYQVPTMYQALL